MGLSMASRACGGFSQYRGQGTGTNREVHARTQSLAVHRRLNAGRAPPRIRKLQPELGVLADDLTNDPLPICIVGDHYAAGTQLAAQGGLPLAPAR